MSVQALLASYSGKNINAFAYASISKASLEGGYSIYMSADGTKLIYNDDAGNIYFRTLSTAFNISTAGAYTSTMDLADGADKTVGLSASSDGMKVYIVSTSVHGVDQFNLSTAWTALSGIRVEDASYSLLGSKADVKFSDDGTKMYVYETATGVRQYTLGTAWSVSTASSAGKFKSTTAQTSAAGDISFVLNGTRMYLFSEGDNKIYQYTLSTAWDISTATYDSLSLTATAISGTYSAMHCSPDGRYVYISSYISAGNFTIYQYQ